ncbi:hypothetical protein J8281_18675 [Aquimarina sp. U1-2]|uniref:hypothetical protein n=1 Tax=Aquimarina sp. U1-2 TaxID=2823141 RepID=UPI001AEC8097|nr:hypothetical protein [Aquimarina sp. U1-2]MBP2834228.1 hypothetical protein [Aquimarina sp. U1-2]
MAITFSILVAIFGYSTSKYFPDDVPVFSKLGLNKSIKIKASAICYGLALVLFVIQFGSGTGSLVWLFTIILILSTLILGLPYKSKLIYAFLGCSVLFLIYDIASYAR